MRLQIVFREIQWYNGWFWSNFEVFYLMASCTRNAIPLSSGKHPCDKWPLPQSTQPSMNACGKSPKSS